MSPASIVLEVLPRDLWAYRKGNTGIDYVHRFESGRAGPHVLVNALTHGNELCGMVAATHLLDSGVRPKIGTLTVSFANVQAYESFDAAKPFYLGFERNAAVALAIGRPDLHLVMPRGMGTGTPLIQHGLHGQAQGTGVALVAECGQHFLRSSADLAIEVTLDFLAHFRLIERNPARPVPGSQRRFELLDTAVVKTEDMRFVRPLVGLETFAKGELIAVDGTDEIRAPCDGCTVFMPTRTPIVGREMVYLTRPVV